MRSDQIIIQPVLTEKTNLLREESAQKKYVFRVHQSANKLQVMQAIKEMFSVKPVRCNIVNVKSKPRMSRQKKRMVRGGTTPWKKAIVTLKEGDKIAAFETV